MAVIRCIVALQMRLFSVKSQSVNWMEFRAVRLVNMYNTGNIRPKLQCQYLIILFSVVTFIS